MTPIHMVRMLQNKNYLCEGAIILKTFFLKVQCFQRAKNDLNLFGSSHPFGSPHNST